MNNLDAIFAKRLGGSYNIRGISFQIRYSILRAFELYENAIRSLTLEGIEDLDLKGITIDDNTFIQVKTSGNPWKWHQIKQPIINFIETYKINPNGKFVLVLDSPYNGDLDLLSKYKGLDDKRKKGIENKLIRLVKKDLNESEGILLSFLNNLTITHLSDENLLLNLREKITENLEVNTKACDIYLSILISNFLEWAKQRKSIQKSDLQNVILDAKEKLSVELQFQATGRGLIGKINWDTENYVDDYYEGKNTQPSHISANADYKRLKWLGIIDKAVMKSRLCVIKASSGQGKSTLLYRYAHDYWIKENAYRINICNSLEHVQLISEFIRHRANLGLPILVLIDNVNFEVQYWSNLFEACSGFDRHFLVSIRKEDWFRYGKENLEYEVIEPTLDLLEAREIYNLLKKNGKINKDINSPEIAFEKIGNDKLLIEYIYLLTQGTMLKERLKDQIRQINNNKEDPVKIDILRKVSLSSVFNAPLKMDKLMDTLHFQDDPQSIFSSLNNEYLKIDNELLQGMHWVRSEHLYRILFENYLNPSLVVLEILNAIPIQYIKVFISDLLSDPATDKEMLINGLVKKQYEFNLDIIISITEGFYIAGEKNFCRENKNILDDAFKLLGPNGPSLLASELLIATTPIHTLDKMIEVFGEERGINFRKLKDLYNKFANSIRGIDYSKSFLENFMPNINPNNYSEDFSNIAKLLDWMCFCKMEPVLLDEHSKILLQYLKNYQGIPIYELTLMIQAVYKFNKEILINWYYDNSTDLTSYLKFETDSIFLEISKDNLSFKFIPRMGEGESVHEQTIKRVKLFHNVLPFVKSISSEGLYYLPNDMKPSNDESVKNNIEGKSFYFESDIEKNKAFLAVVNENYVLDSYYEYQHYLNLLRIEALKFFKEFSSILTKLLKRIPSKAKSSFEDGALPERIMRSITKFPELPPQTKESLKEEIKGIIDKWSMSIKNFIAQIDSYIFDQSQEKDLNLALINLRNAVEILPELHKATTILCNIAPDYFHMQNLTENEIKEYTEVYDLVELNYKIKPNKLVADPLGYIRSNRNIELENKIKFIKKQFIDDLNDYVFSDTIAQREGLSYYPIMFKIDNIQDIYFKLINLLTKLSEVKDVVSFFCLIPIKNQKRVVEGYYFIGSDTIEKVVSGQVPKWEAFIPTTFRSDLIKGLPNYELAFSNDSIPTAILATIKLNLEFLKNYNNIILKYLVSTEQNEYQAKLLEKHKAVMYQMLKGLLIIKNELTKSPEVMDTQIIKFLNDFELESKVYDVTMIDYSKWIANAVNL